MSLRRSALSVPLLAPALALALAVAAVPLATPAVAAPAGAATAAPGPQDHCILAAGAAKATCFATFPEAVAAITQGRVRAPASPAAAATDPSFTAAIEADAVTAAQVVVAVEWVHAGFTGGSLSLYASGRCDDSPDADYVFNTLPAGWNDVITSFRGYNNCAQQLFRNTYRGGGALTGILNSSSNVGAPANDQASSLTAN